MDVAIGGTVVSAMDDSQVEFLSVGKVAADADGPRTVVRIERLDDEHEEAA